VVGDTVGDIRSGLAAGARIVAGVLTGAHDRDRLTAAGATHVLDSVAQLTTLLLPDTGFSSAPSTTALQ
jgi:phosphoglycolate phosphatase-like HAD superfamily hydrolase